MQPGTLYSLANMGRTSLEHDIIVSGWCKHLDDMAGAVDNSILYSLVMVSIVTDMLAANTKRKVSHEMIEESMCHLSYNNFSSQQNYQQHRHL